MPPRPVPCGRRPSGEVRLRISRTGTCGRGSPRSPSPLAAGRPHPSPGSWLPLRTSWRSVGRARAPVCRRFRKQSPSLPPFPFLSDVRTGGGLPAPPALCFRDTALPRAPTANPRSAPSSPPAASAPRAGLPRSVRIVLKTLQLAVVPNYCAGHEMHPCRDARVRAHTHPQSHCLTPNDRGLSSALHEGPRLTQTSHIPSPCWEAHLGRPRVALIWS